MNNQLSAQPIKRMKKPTPIFLNPNFNRMQLKIQSIHCRNSLIPLINLACLRKAYFKNKF